MGSKMRVSRVRRGFSIMSFLCPPGYSTRLSNLKVVDDDSMYYVSKSVFSKEGAEGGEGFV